ncbi:glycosyltransferase [Rouxiella sp. Mn2063]|uniref:glycosyltransferase n=1 Tax=Rouxiella sp. Mn2063 TaxID=3395262 RepID=UPI003BD74BC9
MSELHWSIDSFVQRGTTVFSYGWIFNESKQIKHLSLILPYGNGQHSQLNIDYGKKREDVGAYFSDSLYSTYCGFILYGTFNTPQHKKTLKLLCTYSDDSIEYIDVPESSIVSFDHQVDDNHIPKKVVVKQFFVMLKRAFMLVKGGAFSALYRKVKRFGNNAKNKKLVNANDITSILPFKERAKTIFILDHDLGGGANHYRNQLIKDKISEGYSALILAFNISSLSYKLLIKSSKQDLSFNIPSLNFIYDLLNYITVKEIIYNTGVSFINPETIPSFLIDLKVRTNAKLITLAHDLFPICPSHFLLNDKGKYCNIPDPRVCVSCLRNNTYGFTTLFESGDINKWRDQWGGLIIASDKLIAFSENTLNLYRRVYSQIQPENVEIIPHTVSFSTEKAVIEQKERLRIGVVGNIGYHKGADFVKELALEIKNTNFPADIVVVGTIETLCPADVLTQTGPYEQDELPNLIQNSGINIILFTSIWPETFSYVVQEMMELGYPVACFDLGAPAERLKHYKDGLILSSMSADKVLQELVHFHKKVYSI